MSRALLIIFIVALGAGVVFAKVNPTSPRYNRKQLPPEKACVDGRRSFPHETHTKGMSLKCESCHVLITKENILEGEVEGEVRGPDHSNCIGCHSEKKKGVTDFFEPDDAKRIICTSCHAPRKDERGKPIEGSENDPSIAPNEIDYADPADKSCYVSYGFDFSHASHSFQSCADCHALLTDKDPKAGMMIKSPAHPQCFRCHPATGVYNANVVGPDNCGSCHRYGKDRKSASISYVSGGREDFFMKFSHQSHIETFGKKNPEKKSNTVCESCHKGADRSSSLLNGLSPAKDKSISSACFCCHYKGNDLSKGAFDTSSSNCGKCHQNASTPIPASHNSQGSCDF